MRGQLRAPITPTVGAIVFFWLSLTPSLLPRTPFFQALVSAIALVFGYGLGSLIGWIIRGLGGRLVGRRRRLAWRIVALAGGLGTLVMLWLSLRWENEVRDLVGFEQVGLGHVLTGVVLLAGSRSSCSGSPARSRHSGALGRLMAGCCPQGGDRGRRPVVAFVVYEVVLGFAGGRLLAALDSTSIAINDEFSTTIPPPTIPEVSAGPGSGEDWEDLGRQGRLFIANTPEQDDIEAFSGRPALQPVRAYIGAGPAGVRLRDEAARAADELERLGGFERAVVNVVTGTGRGWVNENQAQALEYMWNGDTATVSLQYSYLPSWMSFLVDGARAQEAGRVLFDAIYARWLELPEADRPLLVVSGESLGTFGSEAAFSGDQDLATRTDGALYVGPTNNNTLWSRFTEERDAGTHEAMPTYDGGATVRFADDPSDWAAAGPWAGHPGRLPAARERPDHLVGLVVGGGEAGLALGTAGSGRVPARVLDPVRHHGPARRGRPDGRQRRTGRAGPPVRPGARLRLGGDPAAARLDCRGHRAARPSDRPAAAGGVSGGVLWS